MSQSANLLAFMKIWWSYILDDSWTTQKYLYVQSDAQTSLGLPWYFPSELYRVTLGSNVYGTN